MTKKMTRRRHQIRINSKVIFLGLPFVNMSVYVNKSTPQIIILFRFSLSFQPHFTESKGERETASPG